MGEIKQDHVTRSVRMIYRKELTVFAVTAYPPNQIQLVSRLSLTYYNVSSDNGQVSIIMHQHFQMSLKSANKVFSLNTSTCYGS